MHWRSAWWERNRADKKTDSQAGGASVNQPTTLETAIARVVTGDAIILRGGTYRTGALQLNQGVTLQPYLDETPVLKGTRVATQWESLANGEALQSVGWAGEMGSKGYYIDYAKGHVYIGVNPAGKLVEITAHDIALHRPSRPVHGRCKALARRGSGPTTSRQRRSVWQVAPAQWVEAGKGACGVARRCGHQPAASSRLACALAYLNAGHALCRSGS